MLVVVEVEAMSDAISERFGPTTPPVMFLRRTGPRNGLTAKSQEPFSQASLTPISLGVTKLESNWVNRFKTTEEQTARARAPYRY